VVWPRGLREAGLALAVATVVLLPLATLDIGPLRILETASLDLRFRLRGPKPPGKEIAVILVDDRSLAAQGRWPLSRRLFAEGVRAANREGAKLIVFDLLFAEPDQPLPPELRDSARAAAAQLSDPRDASLRATLDRFAADDPDGDLAEAMKTGGNVLLPLAFSLTGERGANRPNYWRTKFISVWIKALSCRNSRWSHWPPSRR
jgi:CHASE2 domain-containing sensor protein